MYSEIWTLEKVKEGFEKFYKLYNRYPTAYDVDDFDFLPSSRQIQRRFGGLVNLRETLGLKVKNYTSGKDRSNTIFSFNKRGRACENMVYKALIKRFDEKFIHIERPTCDNIIIDAYDNKSRYDFYVYAKPNNFAVDVFGTDATRGVVNIINMKEKKYRKINSKETLYFVYFGNNIDKGKIKNWTLTRKNKFPTNWKIVNIDDFTNELLMYTSFRAI